jgi:hypothetical protein
MHDGSHSYDRKYNVCTEDNVSLYVDTIEEVRAIHAERGAKFVAEGYADRRWHRGYSDDTEVCEIIRRTDRRVPESEYA